MKKDLQNKHDKLIKETFAYNQVAKEYFKEFLPEALKKVIDVESMQRLESDFSGEDWTQYFADMVFQFKVKESDKDLRVSLLFEHKSYPDKNILIQVGNYLFHHWSKELKSKKKLTPIIPLIYYQGKQKWSAPPIKELFVDYPEDLTSYLPTFDFIQFSVNTLSQKRLDQITDEMLYFAMLSHDPRVGIIELLDHLNRLSRLKENLVLNRNLIDRFFVYKLDNSKINKDTIMSRIKELPDNVQKDFVSTYDQIFNEGEARGVAQMILAMHEDKFTITQIARIAKKTEAEIIEILKKNGRKI